MPDWARIIYLVLALLVVAPGAALAWRDIRGRRRPPTKRD